MLVDAMKADGTDIATANIVYVGGDPTDGNAKQFHDGADSVLKAAGMPSRPSRPRVRGARRSPVPPSSRR